MARKVVIEVEKDGFSLQVHDGEKVIAEQYKVKSGGLVDCIRGNFEDEPTLDDDLFLALSSATLVAHEVQLALEVAL
jgi:hypothetical protein